MNVNHYALLSDLIEEGLMLGFNRSYKHSDDPHPETIRENAHREIMNQICEYYKFGNDLPSERELEKFGIPNVPKPQEPLYKDDDLPRYL